jgi:hypothetical protein
MIKEYMCNTTCWVASKRAMFNPGDKVQFNDGEAVPDHFTLIEIPKVANEDKEIKVENSKVEEIKVETPIIEVTEEKEEQPRLRKPKRFGE